MLSFFDVNTIFFTVLGYPMSYIEFIGTILYLWSVVLITRKSVLTWPVSIISVILFGILYYQIQLYSDTIEQIYYLITGFYGWVYWKSQKEESEDNTLDVDFSRPTLIAIWGLGTVAVSILLGYFFSIIHTILPVIFPVPASFPYLDALTTIMSFSGAWLMIRKHTESWVYFIIVDVIGVFLYYDKSVKFISLLYFVLFFMATNGFIKWLKSIKIEQDS